LQFFRRTPARKPDDRTVIEACFMAELSLAGKLEIAECYCCTRSEAKAIASAWQRHYDEDLELLKWRYDKVKAIARRSVPQSAVTVQRYDVLPEEPAAAGLRVGRNDPCPGGSGKKFKKCCWQKSIVAPRLR
jgi:hypothetical protein